MELLYRIFIGYCKLIDWILWPVFVLYSLLPKRKLPRMLEPEILTLSASKLARKIRMKEISCEKVVKAYVQHCQKVNPLINAIVDDRFVDALIEARTIDQQLQTTQKTIDQLETETPFLGVPFTVKESCAVAGMSFSIGSKPRVGIRAEKDGAAIQKMRLAGAIPIAVTNTPEFCVSYETSNYVTGYTRNPYDLHRAAGGSAGGEAALVSSAGSVIGIGSDFAGSIRIPCMFTGLFGHKPTPGIISSVGHFPYVTSTEFLKYFTIGIIARYSEDLKPILSVLAGENAKILGLEKPVNFRDLKIYFTENYARSFPISREIKKSISDAATYLYKHHGCSVEKIAIPELEDSFEICISILSGIDGIKSNLRYATSKDSNILKELFKSFVKSSDYTLDYTVLRFLVIVKAFISQNRRKMYSEMRNNLQKKLLGLLNENGVLIFPTFPSSAFYKRQRITKAVGSFYSILFNILGFPATHVPVGLSIHKMPIGFQIIAAPNQDILCLAIAEQLEVAYGGWVPPPGSK